MTFEPVHHLGRTIGHAASLGSHIFFFGLGATDSETLSARYPEYEFARVTQVHGRAVVPADPFATSEADGHFAARPNLAPVIVTADCVPILLASRTRVAAVHAGWRGVEARIVAAAAEHFDEPLIAAAIGPHLARASFEVGRDVARRLGAVAPAGVDHGDFESAHADAAKAYFDLTALVRAQVRDAFGASVTLLEFTPDTLTTAEYHSYRREGARRGRNLSFVVRNS